MKEERRGFYFGGGTVWLTLTELQGRLSGSPTKHILVVWEDGARAGRQISPTFATILLVAISIAIAVSIAYFFGRCLAG